MKQTPYSRLSLANQLDVERFTQENAHLSEIKGRTPSDLEPWEVVSAVLQWKGITGYTDTVIDLVKNAFDYDGMQTEVNRLNTLLRIRESELTEALGKVTQ